MRARLVTNTSQPGESAPDFADVEQRWSALHAHADLFTTQRDELRENLRTLLDNREESVGHLKHTREQLSELSRELKDTTRDDIAALESARVIAQQNKDDEMRNQGRLETELRRLAALKSDLETQLKRAESGVAKAELARRRLSVTQDALQTLKRIYQDSDRENAFRTGSEDQRGI